MVVFRTLVLQIGLQSSSYKVNHKIGRSNDRFGYNYIIALQGQRITRPLVRKPINMKVFNVAHQNQDMVSI